MADAAGSTGDDGTAERGRTAAKLQCNPRVVTGFHNLRRTGCSGVGGQVTEGEDSGVRWLQVGEWRGSARLSDAQQRLHLCNTKLQKELWADEEVVDTAGRPYILCHVCALRDETVHLPFSCVCVLPGSSTRLSGARQSLMVAS